MTTSDALKVGFARRRSHGEIRRITNEAEYSLTIPASELFLKKGTPILSYFIGLKFGSCCLFQFVEATTHFGNFVLKCGYSVLHFLAVHGEWDKFRK